VEDLFLHDSRFRNEFGPFAGVDEAGRGPLAGPLVACAVVFPGDFRLAGIADSKTLSDGRRRELVPGILGGAMASGTGTVTPDEIDSLGMAEAVRTAFRRAMEPVASPGLSFLVDGNPVSGLRHPCRFLVKGDSHSASVAAAGILAKVTRDDMMLEMDRVYPLYGFARHKGYGSREHLEALRRNGPCPIHRRTFAPLKHEFREGLFRDLPPNAGRLAEDYAAEWLAGAGWRVLHRNWRTRNGELDIVAEKNGVAVFAEVKHALEGAQHLALAKVDSLRRRRIAAAAAEWLSVSGFRGDCRFDVILVTGYPGRFRAEAFENAFQT
jgi:ribonuclease HII/Holliday junction resolvase-like predicted endonuclease